MRAKDVRDVELTPGLAEAFTASLDASYLEYFAAACSGMSTKEAERLPHMQNRKPEAIKRYLEFRLRQFKMLLDAVEDYVEEKHPATGGHS